MNFADRLIKAIVDKKSYLCVGLDPQLRYFPPHILQWAAKTYGPGTYLAAAEAIISFNQAIINATCEFAATFKPQMAFYEKYGSEGVRAFEFTVNYLKALGLDAIIEDAKREDGGDTADAYADGHLGEVEVPNERGELHNIISPFDVDAITVTAWIEQPNLQAFKKVAQKRGKGIFVVDKTSFKPPSSLQEMEDEEGVKGWVKLAQIVSELGVNVFGSYGYSSFGVVMGATYPAEAEIMKQAIPLAFKLVPGFGYQGGGADDAVVAVNDDGLGIIVNNSRATNYAWHPKIGKDFACNPTGFANAAAKAAKQGRDNLNEAVLKKIGKLPW